MTLTLPAPSSTNPAVLPDPRWARTHLVSLVRSLVMCIDAKGATVRVSGPNFVVPTDGRRLSRLVRPVVQDAVRATGSDGRVDVKVQGPLAACVRILHDAPLDRLTTSRTRGLGQARALAADAGVDLYVGRASDGRTEVRIMAPEPEAQNTLLALTPDAPHGGTVTSSAHALGLSVIAVDTLHGIEALVRDGFAARALVIDPASWVHLDGASIVGLRCTLFGTPLIALGDPPEHARPLLDGALPTRPSPQALKQALQSTVAQHDF